MRKKITIQNYLSRNGSIKESVLWHKILVSVENKGIENQKKDLKSILCSKNHVGTIKIRNFIYQFLHLTKDKISRKTDENLLFNLFSSIDSALITN